MILALNGILLSVFVFALGYKADDGLAMALALLTASLAYVANFANEWLFDDDLYTALAKGTVGFGTITVLYGLYVAFGV